MATAKTTKTVSKTASKEYVEAVGRRKTSIARVRITPGKESFTVNDKTAEVYFPTKELMQTIKAPLVLSEVDGAFTITVHVRGGGIHSQADAVKHGIARALVKHNKEFKPKIKKEGLLTRDAREKERRKFGLKKARKAPQWSKR